MIIVFYVWQNTVVKAFISVSTIKFEIGTHIFYYYLRWNRVMAKFFKVLLASKTATSSDTNIPLFDEVNSLTSSLSKTWDFPVHVFNTLTEGGCMILCIPLVSVSNNSFSLWNTVIFFVIFLTRSRTRTYLVCTFT